MTRSGVPIHEIYGEVGVRRRIPLIVNASGWLDGDYDRQNPDGSACGRRNYGESSFLSGVPALEPGEYQTQGDFYRQYRLDETPGT